MVLMRVRLRLSIALCGTACRYKKSHPFGWLFGLVDPPDLDAPLARDVRVALWVPSFSPGEVCDGGLAATEGP
jgi:hypothetical protein